MTGGRSASPTPVSRSTRRRRVAAIVLVCSALGLLAHDARAARTVYLFYPDGKASIPTGYACRGITVPPPYWCNFGGDAGIERCKREVQGFLDRFYADFDVQFTMNLPTSGPFYTVVITSGWDSCAQNYLDN